MTSTYRQYTAFFTLLTLLFLTTLTTPELVRSEANPSQLDFEVYSDGVVHIEFMFLVNQSLPQVNLTLLGLQYQNLVVVDENETFLDYIAAPPTLIVDSLGAQKIHLEYDGLDLTNKTLGIWTIAIPSLIDYTITFPVKTTILDLNEPPLEIETIEQHPVLTMPAGQHIISYLVETLTPQEDARALLDAISTIIAQIHTNGVDTSQAELLLQQAEDAYFAGNYTLAEQLAMDALELAYELEEAEPLSLFLPLLLGGAGIILLCSFLMYRRKRRQPINVTPILKAYPWLREDQRDVIRYLAQRPNGVFEAELRRVFNAPKSTMWRLIKKLEEEDILQVEQIHEQNYVKLKKPRS